MKKNNVKNPFVAPSTTAAEAKAEEVGKVFSKAIGKLPAKKGAGKLQWMLGLILAGIMLFPLILEAVKAIKKATAPTPVKEPSDVIQNSEFAACYGLNEESVETVWQNGKKYGPREIVKLAEEALQARKAQAKKDQQEEFERRVKSAVAAELRSQPRA